MSTELAVISPTALSDAEKSELETNIDSLIAAHKGNRQEINRLVFESVAAMTAGEDYERQLSNKKGLKRFLGGITGSNKSLQDKINSNRAAAQYASQQILQRLAEQNLMSFDLITAVNNKLNASVTAVEDEINQIYSALLTFFKQSKSDMVRLENRVERLERNVNLLNWQNAIEYQMFQGIEYSDLGLTAKIVCLIRDFYDITKGSWTTSDLLLLKSAMNAIGISPKDTIDYYGFIKSITYQQPLNQYLLNGKQVERLPESYLVPLLGMKKMELLDGEESFFVDSMGDLLEEKGVTVNRKNLCSTLTKKYLMQESRVNVDVQVSVYDLIMEMLFNLQMAENIGIFDTEDQPIDECTQKPTADNSANLDVKFQIAAELFKKCELAAAHPILLELSEQGYARANALLYWLVSDGYLGCPGDEEKAKEYAIKGYQAGDVICALQYALYGDIEHNVRVSLCTQYKPQLIALAEAGDVFAVYMMGLCYLNETDEPKNYLVALEWFKTAQDQVLYRAYYGESLRYYWGQGVEEDVDWALAHFQMTTRLFPKYIQPLEVTADIYYDRQEYEEALERYLNCIGIGGTQYQYLRVGYMYMEGQGTEKNFNRAIAYFEKGAALGSGGCYTDLGWIYQSGDGFCNDMEKGAEYYQKAAELGDACGQYNLGYCYLNGRGVPYDREQAKYWLEKSAEQGWQRAIDMLDENF